MSGCDHKFVDSVRCLKCGVHADDLHAVVRPLRSEEREAFSQFVRFCQREPLPKTDAERKQREFEASERWPEIAKLLGGGGGDGAARQ
jgi:hypothetical protein